MVFEGYTPFQANPFVSIDFSVSFPKHLEEQIIFLEIHHVCDRKKTHTMEVDV